MSEDNETKVKTARKAQSKPAKAFTTLAGSELDLAQKLSDKYGFDLQQVIRWLLTYGPTLVELILKWFSKQPVSAKVAGHAACDEHVKACAARHVLTAQQALAEAVCLDHCLNCCED